MRAPRGRRDDTHDRRLRGGKSAGHARERKRPATSGHADKAVTSLSDGLVLWREKGRLANSSRDVGWWMSQIRG